MHAALGYARPVPCRHPRAGGDPAPRPGSCLRANDRIQEGRLRRLAWRCKNAENEKQAGRPLEHRHAPHPSRHDRQDPHPWPYCGRAPARPPDLREKPRRPVTSALALSLESPVLKRLILAALLAVPLAAWAFIKPVRVLAPEWNGIFCTDLICTDDPSRLPAASALYDSSRKFVEAAIGPMERKPRVIFCSTDRCFQSFGLGRRSAATLGKVAIVVSPRAWQPYYVRHEMIHHIQNEHLGSLKVWAVSPEWFVEGMAYALSQDPRPVLSEPWQHDRAQFEAWFRRVGKEHLWQEAATL